MLPRFSPRRHFLWLLLASSVVLLVLLNVHLKPRWGGGGGGGPLGAGSGSARVSAPGSAPIAAGPGSAALASLADSPAAASTAAHPTQYIWPPDGPGASVKPVPFPPHPERLPWYMTNGKRRPKPVHKDPITGRRIARLWPEVRTAPAAPCPLTSPPTWPPKPYTNTKCSQEEVGGDRVLNQLMFLPPDARPDDSSPKKLKKILLYNGWSSWGGLTAGQTVFKREQCPVDTCTLTDRQDEAATADAILYKDYFRQPGVPRPPRQIWILYFLECPYHTQHIKYNDVFNWTATYRRDSDLVAPYERWAYYDPRVKQRPLAEMPNYAANKTRKVAWFVSNCAARNGRLQYAMELSKYIQVDIYGACGQLKCLRNEPEKCFALLDQHYKFYLAFENSNCKDYITEKFFVNGLGRNIIPIAMGAQPEDYARSAPLRSYIHVDDFESPKALAAYLHRLDRDDDLYNSYFRWKGTGQFINTHFFCRLCALLHDDFRPKSYRDVNAWWRGPGVCTAGSWRKQGKHKFILPNDLEAAAG
ncbi:Glycoprotein 3-alpha-L-fucosyltransferase A [Frankliniella fusca]|uniref:Fucosyltransferase n=1 Tax=Frankliniella fusca TaxID=407009 RepID=A0AAE1L7H6_9NEOP|nr:Glycoprotein 3-alpha-L-fucosyltransferase A [Frankliniella fusca]